MTSLDAVLDQAIALSGSSGGVAGVWAPWAGVDRSLRNRRSAKAPGRLARHPIPPGDPHAEITCTVLLRLVEAGTVELDDPVADYVDRIPTLEGITLEQLCRHTSGLADYYPTLEPFIANPERSGRPTSCSRTGSPTTAGPTGREVVVLAHRDPAARARPRAAHRSWNDLVKQYVADPLGLDDTVLPPPDTTSSPACSARTRRHRADGKPVYGAVLDDASQSSSMGGVAAGAVSSLDDVRTLSEAFATGSLLGEHHARAQWTTIPLGGSAPAWQSFGIGGAEYGPLRGGFGESPGALTAAFTDPETGLTVVVALNNSTSGADFVREAAFALASLGSKAIRRRSQHPLVELPWSLEQATAKMTELGLCPTA